MTTIPPAIRNYLGEVSEKSDDYQASAFWDDLLTEIRGDLDALRAENTTAKQYEDLIVKLNAGRKIKFGFKERTGTLGALRRKIAYHYAYHYGRLVKLIGNRSPITLKGTPKELAEHAAALAFLRSHKLVDGYTKFMEPIPVESTMSTARHYYFKELIKDLTAKNIGEPPYDIMEIGAGAGNLGTFFALSGLVKSYTIVDLPEMLLLSSFTISKYLPESVISFSPTEEVEPGAITFRFLTPDMVDKIPDQSRDLMINITSMMEMDLDVRDNYLKHIYRIGRPNSLFFNNNRRQSTLPLHDGSTWDNNPLLYPYRTDDKILMWEECPFHQFGRMHWHFKQSLCFMRAAVINQTA